MATSGKVAALLAVVLLGALGWWGYQQGGVTLWLAQLPLC